MPISIRLQAVFVVLLAIALYANTWRHGYALDDVATIEANKFVQMGWAGIPEMFRHTLWFGYDGYESVNSYRPLAHMTFAVEFALAGSLRPDLSHVVNTMLYAVVCLLLWMFLRRLFGQWESLAFFASLLFVVHPVHTESVANLKNRDELLALFFGLAAALMFLQAQEKDKRYIGAAALSYALGLLCKESLAAWIFIFTLILFYDPKLVASKKNLLATTAIFTLTFTFVWWARNLITAKVIPQPQSDYWNNPILLADSWITALGTKLYVLGKYLQLSLAPHTLTSSYFYNDLPLLPVWSWQSILSLAVHAFLAYAMFGYLLRRHPLGFAIAFYGITLAMFSNFFMFYFYTAALSERFLLIPSIGACIAGGYALQKLSENNRSLALVLLGLITAAAALKTIVRNRAWADSFTVAQTDLQVSPQSYLLNATMGLELYKKAEAQNNVYLLRQAIPYFEKAVQLDAEDPNIWEYYGRSLALLGEYRQAAHCFEQALRINPRAMHLRTLLEQAYRLQR
ncbi:glycosyltransferase family 39 protein [Rhodoflexus sp.]